MLCRASYSYHYRHPTPYRRIAYFIQIHDIHSYNLFNTQIYNAPSYCILYHTDTLCPSYYFFIFYYTDTGCTVISVQSRSHIFLNSESTGYIASNAW